MKDWQEVGRQILIHQGVNPDALKLARTITSPVGAHLDYMQVHDGLPVFDAGAKLHIGKGGQLLDINLDLRQNIPPVDRLGPLQISAEKSEAIAVSHVGGAEVLRGEPTKELGILPMPNGRYTLAWRVLCPAYQPAGDWLFQVNGQDGSVLSRENLMLEQIQARVFYPNPIVTSGNRGLYNRIAAGDNSQLLAEQTRPVELQGIRSVGERPVIIGGELVRILDMHPPRVADQDRETLLTVRPGTPSFAAVMTYFWLDTLIRYLRRLGFTDLLKDGAEADPHDGTLEGGAYYSRWSRRMGFAPATGRHPAMAEDADVILHELGHAIQNDQVRDWGGHPEAKAMGEGFGDALAAIYFAHVNDGFNRAIVGDWARPPEGIRRVDHDLRYPVDIRHEAHHDGQIWSRALWDLYRLLGGDSSDQEEQLRARDTALRLIVQSHYFLGKGARFADGAQALLRADEALYNARHSPLIRRAISCRGIPVSSPETTLSTTSGHGAPAVHQNLPAASVQEWSRPTYADLAAVAHRATRGFPWRL